jgi:hypothetical protein
MRRNVAVLLFCIAFLLLPMQSFASADVSSDLDNLAKHIQSSKLDSDWEVIALAKVGKLTDSQRDTYLDTVKRVDAKALSGTDLDKTVLVVKALGQDPQNFQNHDLIKSIYTDASIKTLMDFTYALTALSSDDYPIPSDAQWTPKRLIDQLVPLQTDSGGWGWAGDPNGDPDVDTTCMVLTALSRYQDVAKDAIDKAINYLKSVEQNDGGFVNYSPNSNSAAQVILALSSLGIDPTAGAFDKNGHNPMNNLDQYKSNGGYKWAAFSESDDPFSNEQVLQALAAYSLFAKGDQLFNFRTKETVADTSSSENESVSSTTALEKESGEASSIQGPGAEVNQDQPTDDPENAEPESGAAESDSSHSESETIQTSASPKNNGSAQHSANEKTAASVDDVTPAASSQISSERASTAKEKAASVSHSAANSDAARSSAQRPEQQDHVQSEQINAPKKVTMIKRMTQLNPFHLYFGSGLILLGLIGLCVRYWLGGVRHENE